MFRSCSIGFKNDLNRACITEFSGNLDSHKQSWIDPSIFPLAVLDHSLGEEVATTVENIFKIEPAIAAKVKQIPPPKS
jgi:hypothetical protein